MEVVVLKPRPSPYALINVSSLSIAFWEELSLNTALSYSCGDTLSECPQESDQPRTPLGHPKW